MTRCVAIVGGTGFVGRNIAAYLRSKGPQYTLRIGSRRPSPSSPEHVLADVTQPDTLARAVEGAHVVVSLAGYLQASDAAFDAVQRRGAGNVAAAARNAGAALVHVSAIGADARSSVAYWRTKALGEQEVLAELPQATIVRPSLVFGPGDEFFGRFAKLAKVMPFVPVFDGGKSRLQPVYVGDIARFVELCARGTPEISAEVTGKIVEAGGPEVFTYRELMELVLKYSDRRRPILSLPSSIGKLQAYFLERLPPNLFSLTRDQVEQLKYDNVVTADPRVQPQCLDFDDFLMRFSDNPKLTSVHEILPHYLRS